MTKLLPQFDPDAESENPFKILGKKDFKEEKVEAYLALTFKAIEETDTYGDVADKIKSNKIFNDINYNLIIKRDYLAKIWCHPKKKLVFQNREGFCQYLQLGEIRTRTFMRTICSDTIEGIGLKFWLKPR